MSGKYDITLKELFVNQPSKFLEILTGFDKGKFLNPELPEVVHRDSDLVIEHPDDSIFQLEIQSTNDDEMPTRMLGYGYFILSKFKKFPKQMVLYVGLDELTMKDHLHAKSIKYWYYLKDIREIDAKMLLDSDLINDNIISILCKTDDDLLLIRTILDRIKKLKSEVKIRNYLKKLIEISHLRKFDTILLEEVKKMPITIDIKESALYKEGKLEGKQEGKLEGIKEGLEQGIEKKESEIIINLYVELKQSIEQIAKMVKSNKKHVEKILKENDIL